MFLLLFCSSGASIEATWPKTASLHVRWLMMAAIWASCLQLVSLVLFTYQKYCKRVSPSAKEFLCLCLYYICFNLTGQSKSYGQTQNQCGDYRGHKYSSDRKVIRSYHSDHIQNLLTGICYNAETISWEFCDLQCCYYF